MLNLGLLYENGQGVGQDYAKARELFQRALFAGNTDALKELSRLQEKLRMPPFPIPNF